MELLDFYADWCGPCQMLKPILAEFAEKHPEVKITRINIDEDEKLAEQYNVSGIPCLVALKDGEEVARQVGVIPLKRIKKLVGIK